VTALEKCHEMAQALEKSGWNRETYEALNELAYQSGICITEAFEDGFLMVEDEVYYIDEK
jgi:hypothetical protein